MCQSLINRIFRDAEQVREWRSYPFSFFISYSLIMVSISMFLGKKIHIIEVCRIFTPQYNGGKPVIQERRTGKIMKRNKIVKLDELPDILTPQHVAKLEFTITGMKIGEFDVPVPHGLSELINRANAWVLRTDEPLNEGYHREVIKRNGKIVTVLTKIKS